MTKIRYLCMFMCITATMTVFGQAAMTEHKQQALFIKNFLKYIELEGNKTAVIGVLGDSPVLIELQEIMAKTASTTKVVKIANMNGLGECNIVYVPKNNYKNLSNINSVQGGTLMVISEDSQPFKAGADISFIVQESKLSFYIDEHGLARKKIKVSAQLVSLAKK